MQVRVLAFGALRDHLPDNPLVIDHPGDGATVGEVLGTLLVHLPVLREGLATTAFAVGDELVGLDAPLVDGSELCLIPPVSGG